MDADPPPFFSSSSWDWKAGGAGGALELGRGSPAHSLSPSPSFDSYASSSPYPLLLDVPGSGSGGSEAGGSLLRGYPLGEFSPSAVYLSRAGLGPGAKGAKGRMSVQRRRKASEREKLRMRTLAEALHTLRDYLPPGYTQRGQPLTKIQTLKCTIKYIGDLTDLLSAVKQGQRP